MINHQSSVFLFDPDTGRAAGDGGGQPADGAAHGGGQRHIHRPAGGARGAVLGIVGAGHQAGFQLRARRHGCGGSSG